MSPNEGLAEDWPHASVLEVLPVLRRHIEASEPLSLVRLGDGEGRLLGYPEIVDKAELDTSLHIWFGRTDLAEDTLRRMAGWLREAVRAADVVGLPRATQAKQPEYRRVFEACDRFELLAHEPLVTDAAIHRYLQLGLFYRELLEGLPFGGLVTCRDISAEVQRVFRITQVEQWLVPGETKFPGPVRGEHFPVRFEELQRELRVPHRGAVFLVGAGALGKIYCQWIKERGGVALDVGSLCDAWAGGGVGRLRKACHGLAVYEETGPLSREQAVRHFNRTVAREGLRIGILGNTGDDLSHLSRETSISNEQKKIVHVTKDKFVEDQGI